MRDLDSLIAMRPPPSGVRAFTAVVVRSDSSGVWVAPIGADARTPLGPCHGGATYRASTEPAGEGTHSHPLVAAPLPTGALVLAVATPGGVWIAAHDLP